MALFGDNWIRVFDIPETSKHVKGFTIYKILSIVYPKSCPDAVTKVTVWKRYNDLKQLYLELKQRYKSMQISDKYPSLISSSYFKRFDPEIVEQRKNCVLLYLEFVAQHPSLFKSIEFVKFFESSHTPQESLNSNINIIRAQLNLPSDPEIVFSSYNSDNEQGHSDSDTVSTFSSVSTSALKDDVFDADPKVLSPDLHTSIKISSALSNISKVSSHDSASSSGHSLHDTSVDSFTTVYPTPPLTPESIIVDQNNSMQYLTNAAHFVTQATEFEIDRKYEEAFDAYKAGISCLLSGVKSENDVKRRQMVRHKTEIYLLRAEKIYNIHLSPEITQIRESVRRGEAELSNVSVKRPLVELFDFKVLKVVDSGMVVLHKMEHNLFYMKVIEKNPQTSSSIYIKIPRKVPYMVKLFQYYDSFNAVFIVTQYINGEKLFDYIKQKSSIINDNANVKYSNVTFEGETDRDSGNFHEINSDSSECSYTDLINNYTLKKSQSNSLKLNCKLSSTDIDSYSADVPANSGEIFDSDRFFCISDDVFMKTSSSMGDLVVKSQQLLTSVSDTLLQRNLNSDTSLKITLSHGVTGEKSALQRKFSEKSFTEEFSSVNYVSPLKDIVKWASQLLLALEKLHHYGIVVIDLNPRHLFVDVDGNIRLTFKCSFQESNKIFCYQIEKDYYCAPEVFGLQSVTFAADWWSYGVILFELLTGMPLCSVHSEGISSYTLVKVPKYVCPEGKSLLRQLLIYEPGERLGCGINGTEDLKSHPFFNRVDWNQLHTGAFV